MNRTNDQLEIGTPGWAARVADSLNTDERFAASLATWDGAVRLRDENGSSVAFRIYKGSMIDSGSRVGGDIAFTLTIPSQSWERMLAADSNTFMNEAMSGAFTVDGSGYEYLRLAKPLSFIVDAARALTGRPRDETSTSTKVAPPVDSWAGKAHYLQIDGSLAYVETGAPTVADLGTTVVLLHTAGQSGVQYRRVVPRLNQLGYRTIVPDYPGHGRSEPAVDGPITDLGEYAEWVLRVLDRLPVESADLVVAGCSIGGKIAIDLATRMDGRLAGAVAMAASAGPGIGNRRALLRDLEDVATPSRAERTQLGTRAVVGAAVSSELRELIATMHRREDPVISASDLLGWTSHDVTGRLADIECPLVLVGGSDDLWLDLDAMRETAASVKRSTTVVLDGIGHYPPQEMTDFADVLHGWIQDCLAQAVRS